MSAEVLGVDVLAALYIHEGKPSARALLEVVDRVATHAYPPAACM